MTLITHEQYRNILYDLDKKKLYFAAPWSKDAMLCDFYFDLILKYHATYWVTQRDSIYFHLTGEDDELDEWEISFTADF